MNLVSDGLVMYQMNQPVMYINQPTIILTSAQDQGRCDDFRDQIWGSIIQSNEGRNLCLVFDDGTLLIKEFVHDKIETRFIIFDSSNIRQRKSILNGWFKYKRHTSLSEIQMKNNRVLSFRLSNSKTKKYYDCRVLDYQMIDSFGKDNEYDRNS
jgi:hypothetical protein